ncbi:MAG: proline racemase family protein [Planctomycetes bacterium]|nr:proline racemase family protein [Planctomycetota bacterium]MCB9884264.1 proline racemase family protein [Planctomycetota bacterium]
MLRFSQVVSAVDSHTAGEPTRIVTGGLPAIAGATMADKRASLQRDHDHLRRALVLEPRGHDAIVLAYLLPPCDPKAHLGVVFANDAGYLGMCGHGAIGVATVAVAMGMVKAVAPRTEVVLDTPAGTVRCEVAVEDGRPRSVTITNVPSFLWRQRAIVDVHGFGKVAADIAYGGNWFAFVEAEQLGLQVGKVHLPVLMQAATAVRDALIRDGVRGVHPDKGVEELVDHVKLFVELPGEEPGARALTLCPGVAYDRSPCGTGTSAKLAVLHAKGELEVGRWFRSESVLGTAFRARIAGTTKVGRYEAVVPEVEGSAYVTALTQFVIDPDDPLAHGI